MIMIFTIIFLLHIDLNIVYLLWRDLLWGAMVKTFLLAAFLNYPLLAVFMSFKISFSGTTETLILFIIIILWLFISCSGFCRFLLFPLFQLRNCVSYVSWRMSTWKRLMSLRHLNVSCPRKDSRWSGLRMVRNCAVEIGMTSFHRERFTSLSLRRWQLRMLAATLLLTRNSQPKLNLI